MSLFPRFPDGHYDDTGHWQRNKFCFMDCGARCTCKPPGGLWFDPRKVKSEQEQKPESEEGSSHEDVQTTPTTALPATGSKLHRAKDVVVDHVQAIPVSR